MSVAELSRGFVMANPLRDRSWRAAATPSPRSFHRRLPGYQPTPLLDVPALAEALGARRVLVKDESHRLALPAFKMLGASWATYRALCERLGDEPGDWQTLNELRDRLAPIGDLTLVTATDGNHGQALARFARLLGYRARIFIPAGSAEARMDAIRAEGAELIVWPGGYDAAVAAAARSADADTLVVSDTSWDGYRTVPQWVIEGYATIIEEIDEQLAAGSLPAPDVAVIPIGVGALAAAVARHFRSGSAQGLTLVGAEPLDAACVLESARAGRIVTLPGEQRSIMAGLNCGTPSPVAWPAVSSSFDYFVALSDGEAVDAMRAFYRCGIRSGESGAASLAAAFAMRRAGLLAERATVLLLATEGVTDPAFYQREIIGHVPEQ